MSNCAINDTIYKGTESKTYCAEHTIDGDIWSTPTEFTGCPDRTYDAAGCTANCAKYFPYDSTRCESCKDYFPFDDTTCTAKCGDYFPLNETTCKENCMSHCVFDSTTCAEIINDNILLKSEVILIKPLQTNTSKYAGPVSGHLRYASLKFYDLDDNEISATPWVSTRNMYLQKWTLPIDVQLKTIVLQMSGTESNCIQLMYVRNGALQWTNGIKYPSSSTATHTWNISEGYVSMTRTNPIYRCVLIILCIVVLVLIIQFLLK